ncbi:hypothetical protein HED22_10090 [Thalassospira sp. HF15]|nr:hypothetical protein [Thalassospira sp. HF15]NIY75994.1 hypothetical protein [Thalassospira sp. HF15]
MPDEVITDLPREQVTNVILVYLDRPDVKEVKCKKTTNGSYTVTIVFN